jgi:selenocysteine-specific elongation factor
MLAGVGPVPAVMFVVAADEGWQAQSDEHLRITDALGVRHAVVAVTKADRGDATLVTKDVVRRLAATTLRGAPVVTVAPTTGEGIDELRAALDAMVAALPTPAADAPVRMWVDRSFTIRGAGTVVTGTLPAGTLRDGLELELVPAGRRVVVRGLESLKQRSDMVTGSARVAVNLRGVDRHEVRRGMALVTPGRWQPTETVDVLGVSDVELPRDVLVHVGAAAVPARSRRLGVRAVRLQLAHPLPLHLGDLLLVRDPAQRVVVGVEVADLTPRKLRRRGEAAAVAAELEVPASADDLVTRKGVVAAEAVARAGFAGPPSAARNAGGCWVAQQRWDEWSRQVVAATAGSGTVDLEVLRRALDVPSVAVLRELVGDLPGLTIDGGQIRAAGAEPADPPEIVALVERLAADPLAAPEAGEVAALDRSALGVASRKGRLLHLAGTVYVGPAAADLALQRLRELPAPFSVSDARQALGVSRRVTVPLLEHLDARRRTRRLPDGTRIVVTPG